MNTKKYLALIATVLVTTAVLAQQQTSVQLDVSQAKLQQHVSYLASDALEGRRTGTTGATDAARYIAGEFSRLGLKTRTQNGRASQSSAEAMKQYLQKFPFVAGVDLGSSNSLSIRTANGRVIKPNVSEEWMPLPQSSNITVENTKAVFVGYGISASELNYDDYSSGNASGNVAVVLSGSPDSQNPHGRFAQYQDPQWKVIAARNAGAKALVIISLENTFKDDPLATMRVRQPSSDAGFPVIVISRELARSVFQGNGIENFEEFLDKAQKALSQQGESSIKGYSINKTVNFDLLGTTAFSISTEITRREVPAYNVVGILEGSHPTLKNEVIIVGAHYDHLGRGGQGSLAQREGEIHHGADDNASGTAGLLELARIFTAKPFRPKRTIVFIAFGGEEEGLLGSKFYVNNPLLPLANTVAMLNMDMIGRMKNKKLVIGGVGTAKEWREIINSNNHSQAMSVNATGSNGEGRKMTGLPIVVSANGRPIVTTETEKGFELTLQEDGLGPSDHASFYLKQVPVLFFWTGTHVDYHKPTDTFEKINYEDQAGVVRLVGRIMRELDQAEKRITFTTAKSAATPRTGGFRVYLGTIPSYTDSGDGLLLDGVRDDSPAAKAGLKAGDKIVKIGDRDIKNVYDYTFALGEMKGGQEYSIEVMRGTERLKLKITPEARR